MKELLFFWAFLAAIGLKAQDTVKIAKLNRGDTMVVEVLPFAAIFQKAALVDGKIMATVLNLNEDIQRFVEYKFSATEWVITKIGNPGTFYCGNGKVGTITPGKTANIPRIPNLANERDLTTSPDGEILFTSDFSGIFQIYSLIAKRTEKINIEALRKQNIINLWSSKSCLYFDVLSLEATKSEIYAWKNKSLKRINLKAKSLSFNDSIIVFIQKGRLIVKKSNNNAKIVQFLFAFLNANYEKAITLSLPEAKQLGIDSSCIVEGVLTKEAKQKIADKLEKESNYFSSERKNAILEKIIPQKNVGTIEFYGFFADTSTFVSTKYPVKGVDNNGLIETEKLQSYIKTKEQESTKSELKNILIHRAWNENKEIEIEGTVKIQIGAYHILYTDFPKFLFDAKKVNKKEYLFLESLEIYTLYEDGLILYRTKTDINNLLRIKKAVYFDNPFIVEKDYDNQ